MHVSSGEAFLEIVNARCNGVMDRKKLLDSFCGINTTLKSTQRLKHGAGCHRTTQLAAGGFFLAASKVRGHSGNSGPSQTNHVAG
jgi:hypothetical protein